MRGTSDGCILGAVLRRGATDRMRERKTIRDASALRCADIGDGMA